MHSCKKIYYIIVIMYLEFQLKKETKYGERMQWCKNKIVKYKDKLEMEL